MWTFAATRNEVPPLLPEPIAKAIWSLYLWQGGYFWPGGPLGAVPMVASAMLLTSVVWIGREYLQRSRRDGARRVGEDVAVKPSP